MPITIAVPKESRSDETRVALVPEVVAKLVQKGFAVSVEKGAGVNAGYPDEDYEKSGAKVYGSRSGEPGKADITVRVQPPTTKEVEKLKSASLLIGFFHAHRNAKTVKQLCESSITSFAMELVPRISRAQSMDALSSQATASGYQAALIAARASGKFLPMLTTAAGTIRPSKVLVLGAGVAGLQVIATARRLGGVVEAYDVRRAAGEQVQSLGAKFLALDVDAESEGGYARELTAEEKKQEQAMVAEHVAAADIVITTAQIPGRDAPRLIDKAMIESMRAGSVVVDMAAESGGNCELTELDKVVEHNGVMIHGPGNLPAELPCHASEMYAKNIFNLLCLVAQGESVSEIDWEDEIIAGSALTHEGKIQHEPTRKQIEGDQP